MPQSITVEITNKKGLHARAAAKFVKSVSSFDANGHFFVMFARPDLPKIASTDRTKVTPQEAHTINVGSIAYFGTYTVDEPSKTVSLKIESSTFPNQLGIDQKRVITSLTADELKYTNTTASGGPIDTVFRRAK